MNIEQSGFESRLRRGFYNNYFTRFGESSSET